jgi:23S rRNA (adenine2503-C2)-methyltransferase
MKILRKLEVPTGHIVVAEGERDKLEFLSIGDYGKDVNLKCDAMGLDRDFEGPVKHAEMLPLTEKWVITISTQYGCSMGCEFCDVPHVGPGKNVTELDLINQVLLGLKIHSEITWTNRLNIHFARMGEPTWNPAVLDAAAWYYRHLNPEFNIHPVVSTMMPRHNIWLKTFIHTWMRIKNRMLNGNAGLQLSINSTCELEREEMFNGNACTLEEIAAIMDGIIPIGRKITLNFAVADRYVIDPEILLKYFNPQLYIIKLTPMHKTTEALKNGVKTSGDYTTYAPYKYHEERLKEAGYDVLVFIASVEEDLGRITCGNAILSGTKPEVAYREV